MQDLEIDSMNRVESQIAIEFPEDDNFSLGLDSKNSGSKISDQNQNSKIEILLSDKMPSFIKEELK